MSPEEKLEMGRKLIAEAEAEIAAKKRNWPEKIEDGMQVADCMICGIHPHSFRSGEWARLAGVAMVTPNCMEPRLAYMAIFDDGVVDYIAISDGANFSIKARDLIKIAEPEREPTGAELVGKMCEFSDDGKKWKKGVCTKYERGRDSGSYLGNFDSGYEWLISARLYREDRS